MALQKREKILAALVGALSLALVAWIGAGPMGPSKDELRRSYEKLSQEVAEKQKRVDSIQRKTAKRLAEWNRRSLPSNPEIARSLYGSWLGKILKEAGLSEIQLEPGDTRNQARIYTSISMVVRAQGTLDQLTTFLHRFYSAGHLHRIRRLELKRFENGKKFEFILTVEGLALATADRRDRLTDVTLTLGNLQDYQNILVRRLMESNRYVDGLGIFTPYSPPPPPTVVREERKSEPPPPPPTPPPPPAFDHAKYAFLTAVTEVAGKPQVWVHARTKGETYFLHEGDSIHIGTIQATVYQIDLPTRSVQILVNGRTYLVRHGQTLYEAVHSTQTANTVSTGG